VIKLTSFTLLQMVCRGSKGVVLGGVLACVGASRSHVEMKGASAVHAVDTMSSLLDLQHEEVRRIAEAVDGQATPGASNPYTGSLKAVLDKIKGELKPKVEDAQQDAQRQITEALTAVEEATSAADAAKGIADKEDESWFGCVTQELAKKEFHETAQDALAEAQNDEKEALAKKESSRPVKFDAGNKYQKKMSCDHSVAGQCEQTKSIMMASQKKMIKDAKDMVAAKLAYYQDMEAQHQLRQEETAAAGRAMDASAENHESHRNKCEAAKLRRDKAICEYGDHVQAKGVEEVDFGTIIDDVTGAEEDRVKEWKTLSHMGCMLEKGIAKALKGPIDANDHAACADHAELTPLERNAGKLEQMKKSHPSSARSVTFSNGQAWVVSSNGETAADYKKEAFKPTLNPDENEQPFDMCADENDGWKTVVAEKMTAASNVGAGAWSRLKTVWGR